MRSKIKQGLESRWFLPIVFLLAGVMWGFNLTHISLGVIAVAFLTQFVFCDNIRNIFGLVIFIPLFIPDLGEYVDWTYYIICIALVFVSMIYFIISKCCFGHAKVTKGKMFWAWVISTIVFMLGGVAVNFNILAVLGVLGTALLTYFFYFLAVNFTRGLKEHLYYTLIIGGLTCLTVFMTLIIRQGGDILYATAHRNFIWVGAENINTIAIFYTLAMISCFAISTGKKFDYLYMALAILFEIAIFVTYCRLMILISAIVFILLFVVAIVRSQKRRNYLWTILAMLGVAGILFIPWHSAFIDIVKGLFAKNELGGNGRPELWAWCWQAFKDNMAFGYGFVAYEPVPALREIAPSLVMAHNTALQWLCSIGIVGSIFMLYFYWVKYKTIFVGCNKARFFEIVTILTIASSGVLDQSPIMDFFCYIIPFITIAVVENERKERELAEPFVGDGRLRIGLFIDTYYPMVDGVITVVNNYAKRLCKKAEVIVFCPSAMDKKNVDNFDYRVVRSKSLKIPCFDYCLPIPALDGKFQDALEDAHLDIVHIHSPFSIGKAGVDYARRHNVPCIGHLHSQYKEDVRKAVKLKGITRIVLSIIMRTFNRCDVCWPVNNGIGDLFHDDYHVKTPMIMQQSGTDFTPVADEKMARKWVNEKYNIKDNEYVFCFVGRLVLLKNICFIAEALQIVKEKGVKFKMLYVGNGFDEEQIKTKVHDLGLDDDVIFTGRLTGREEMMNVYARADLLLFPSPYDTDGLVKYEAASQHTPMLSLSGLYCSSNITDNVNGYLSGNSVVEYADRIMEILQDKKTYKKVCDGAYHDLYITWDDCVEKAFNDYLKLIEEKKNKK